jgi:hypothetical protein
VKNCPHKHTHGISFGVLLAVVLPLCGLLDWIMRW